MKNFFYRKKKLQLREKGISLSEKEIQSSEHYYYRSAVFRAKTKKTLLTGF